MQNLPRQIRRQSASQDRPPPAWTLLTGLAVAGAYFFAARLSLALLTKSDGVAVFWPAAGIAAGTLIALGPRVRLAVALGVAVASV
jgi:integral membrane sensor domain MASE1